MTRMMAKTFFGEFKGGHDNISYDELHESPNLMTIPMIILAIPSIIIGVIFSSPIDLIFIEKHAMVSFLDHNKLVFPNFFRGYQFRHQKKKLGRPRTRVEGKALAREKVPRLQEFLRVLSFDHS